VDVVQSAQRRCLDSLYHEGVLGPSRRVKDLPASAHHILHMAYELKAPPGREYGFVAKRPCGKRWTRNVRK